MLLSSRDLVVRPHFVCKVAEMHHTIGLPQSHFESLREIPQTN
jgi:hypothetical protein